MSVFKNHQLLFYSKWFYRTTIRKFISQKHGTVRKNTRVIYLSILKFRPSLKFLVNKVGRIKCLTLWLGSFLSWESFKRVERSPSRPWSWRKEGQSPRINLRLRPTVVSQVITFTWFTGIIEDIKSRYIRFGKGNTLTT